MATGNIASGRRAVAGAGPRRWVVGLLALASALALPALGCRGLMEDTKDNWNDFFNKPDPYQVVTTSDRGDRRAAYLAQLREPAQNRGSQEEQERVVTTLYKAATEDPAPTCRLQAVRALSKFKDPRAVEALEKAYYSSNVFPPDVGTWIRQQALHSLGETGSPAAKDVLVRVAQAGAPEESDYDRQLSTDERLAAVRALGRYKDPEVAVALVQIMKTEKDVAMRDRAHQSLQLVTGKDLPPDPAQWEQALNGGVIHATARPQPNASIQRVLGWRKE